MAATPAIRRSSLGPAAGQRPLSWWQKVTWTKEKTNCALTKLTPKAHTDVMDIRQESSGGSPSETTKRRWDNLFRYVLNDGAFPVAPIVMRRPEGLSPIDGTHRMAVLSALQLIPEANFAKRGLAKPANEQDVWMGKHADDELPNAQ
jgi:hypothetical protein